MTEAGKIRIWATAVESYRFVIRHPRDLMRVGWLPLIVFFAFNILFDAPGLVPGKFDPATIGPALAKAAGHISLLTLIAAAVLVAWHRVVLLDAGDRPGALAVRLGWRELRYLLSWLWLSGVFLVLFVLAWALTVAGGFVAMMALQIGSSLLGTARAIDFGDTEQFVAVQIAAMVPAFLAASSFATRLSLVLPALATDEQRSMARAWTMSAGNGWRLVLAALIVMLPLDLMKLGTEFAAGQMIGTALYYPLVFAASFSLLLLIVATGTVLSLFSVQLEHKAKAKPRAALDGHAILAA